MWAVILKIKNLNTTIKSRDRNACPYHKVKHMRPVYCVEIKIGYILIRECSLCSGLPWLQHEFILTIRQTRLIWLAFLIGRLDLAPDRQYNHSNLISE